MEGHAPSSFESDVVEVFREQRGRMWAFFLRGTAAPEAAEDLLQETFLRVWDRRADLALEFQPRDREGMRRFLWRVARNLMIDEIRFQQRRRPAGDPEALPPGGNPMRELEEEEGIRVVRETVRRMRHAQGRRCLELWLQERSLEEIAGSVGLQVGQVRGLIQRARDEVILRAGNRLRATGGRRTGGGAAR
jgi:RNA polymerase sigma-70 factor (ECF subfamily)